jgi:hypothetical protein
MRIRYCFIAEARPVPASALSYHRTGAQRQSLKGRAALRRWIGEKTGTLNWCGQEDSNLHALRR